MNESDYYFPPVDSIIPINLPTKIDLIYKKYPKLKEIINNFIKALQKDNKNTLLTSNGNIYRIYGRFSYPTDYSVIIKFIEDVKNFPVSIAYRDGLITSDYLDQEHKLNNPVMNQSEYEDIDPWAVFLSIYIIPKRKSNMTMLEMFNIMYPEFQDNLIKDILFNIDKSNFLQYKEYGIIGADENEFSIKFPKIDRRTQKKLNKILTKYRKAYNVRFKFLDYYSICAFTSALSETILTVKILKQRSNHDE